MTTNTRWLIISLLIIALSVVFSTPASAGDGDQPAVHAVLFFSPSCPHCEDVINNHLPSLFDKYGSQLQIVGINTQLPQGQDLYLAMVDAYAVPEDRLGVPALVIGDVHLVGSVEIPEQLPVLIEEHLAVGGIDYPDIRGLDEVLQLTEEDAPAAENTESETTSSSSITDTPNDAHLTTIPDDQNPFVAKLLRDPVGNTVSVVVLVGMVICLVGVVVSFFRPIPDKTFWPQWTIPVLSAIGLFVAFYLSYVETSGAEAVCGPVGDCNAVQLSPYATLFNFLPVGVLGLIGYVMIVIAWLVQYYGPVSIRWAAAIAVWGMAFFGTLFSIYLTFLEPFVIGATCMWCITSAILQTLILMSATHPAKIAWKAEDLEEED